ncbi:MAG: hypothetical protein EA397_17300 [Deltaproteobacteria bacterium]|nr:MAG: hypothetical protein EA397_17300 [Deltaproteobacteria bacterium]
MPIDTFISTLFEAGGFSVALLLWGGLSLLLALTIPFILAFFRARTPPTVMWPALLVLLVLGLAATYSGQFEMNMAVATAPPEFRQTMIAGGLSLALTGAISPRYWPPSASWCSGSAPPSPPWFVLAPNLSSTSGGHRWAFWEARWG